MKSPEYITHGAVLESDAEKIVAEGFLAEEGRATVSTDLIMAFKWASLKEKERAGRSQGEGDGKQGRIIIMKTPENVTADYGLETNIVVDEDKKEVTGFTSRFESGRRYLALYDKDVEANSSEVKVPEENILLSIIPTPELKEKLDELKNKIKNFEKINLIEFTESLVDVIKENKDNVISAQGDIHEAIGNLVVATIEDEYMSIVRAVSLDVKRVMGYKIYNKNEDSTDKRQVELEGLKAMLINYKQIIESPDFDIGLENVERYLRINVNKLLKELDG
jgi:hypothetical protein